MGRDGAMGRDATGGRKIPPIVELTNSGVSRAHRKGSLGSLSIPPLD